MCKILRVFVWMLHIKITLDNNLEFIQIITMGCRFGGGAGGDCLAYNQ